MTRHPLLRYAMQVSIIKHFIYTCKGISW